MTVETGVLWRVCYHEAPLDLAPREMYSFRHRFDDIGRRFERCLLTSGCDSLIWPQRDGLMWLHLCGRRSVIVTA